MVYLCFKISCERQPFRLAKFVWNDFTYDKAVPVYLLAASSHSSTPLYIPSYISSCITTSKSGASYSTGFGQQLQLLFGIY